jgi:hypothetical protein
MSSPPLKSPPLLRWLSILLVAGAIAWKLWGQSHGPAAGAGPARDAPPPATSPAAAAPAAGAHAFGAGVGFRSPERLEEHFQKHGGEFHAASAGDYLRMAQALRDRAAGGDVLERVRADGVITRFDRASGAFLAFGDDGVIRTFFRPNDGERYFERQADRPHGAP